MVPSSQRNLATDLQPEAAILLRWGDDALVLGQRLCEWCGHAPSLELDIAVSNLALDAIGQARHWLTLAAQYEQQGRTENDLAYWRDARAFTNALLLEQPNGDFAMTMMRQFLYNAYQSLMLEDLVKSSSHEVADLAGGMLDEVTYHLRFATDWVRRLGEGTAESHKRMQSALSHLWLFTPELFQIDAVVVTVTENGFAPCRSNMADDWAAIVDPVLDRADLTKPEMLEGIKGGRIGLHSEHLQLMLSEMQTVQRMYPGMDW